MVSTDFEDAASYLSNASSLASTPNSTKLELYGLYKFITTSPDPPGSRPSLFDFTGRAKWDAWKSTGQTWRGREVDAEERYKTIAKTLGWTPGSSSTNDARQSSELTAEELLARDDLEPSGEGGGLGAGVSTLQSEVECATDESMFHRLALEGDAKALETFLNEHLSLNLDQFDDYGFTALHLACDRGHIDIVRILLERGANTTIKDQDGLTAVELAHETGNETIVLLLENRPT